MFSLHSLFYLSSGSQFMDQGCAHLEWIPHLSPVQKLTQTCLEVVIQVIIDLITLAMLTITLHKGRRSLGSSQNGMSEKGLRKTFGVKLLRYCDLLEVSKQHETWQKYLFLFCRLEFEIPEHCRWPGTWTGVQFRSKGVDINWSATTRVGDGEKP